MSSKSSYFVPGSRAIFLVNCSAAFSMPHGPAGPAPSAAPAGLASVALAAWLAAGPYNRAGLQVALLAASDTGSRSAIFLLTSCSHLVELSLDLRQRGDVTRANPALPQGLAALLLALLGHAAGRAPVAKLEPKLLGVLQHVPPVLHIDLLLPATPSASSRSPSKLGSPPPVKLPASAPWRRQRPSTEASAVRGAPGRGWSF